ncbi:hypothetical protein AB6813_00505 [bacterium RCC_150]
MLNETETKAFHDGRRRPLRGIARRLGMRAFLSLVLAAGAAVAMGGCATAGFPEVTLAPRAPKGSGQLASVHTPQTVVQDINPEPGHCHMTALDANGGRFLPDKNCTPGAVDPAVTQANLSQTICRSGYTKTVRPASSLTGPIKDKSLNAYAIQYAETTELDHLVPLELGGASSTSNLWVEPNAAGASHVQNPKDAVENQLNAAVCKHQVSLAAAQQAIASDWTTALQAVGIQ